MVRSLIIFAFFAVATIMVIVLQPGPRPEYAYEQVEQPVHEASRNNVQVLPEPQVAVVLSAPDDTIARLKAAAASEKVVAEAVTPSRSLHRLQAALDASLGNETVSSDARVEVAAKPVLQAAPQRVQTAAQAIAPELRDMSWQTLNALNGIAHTSKAPGQEGSLLNSIVRRSMGHVDGTQIVRPSQTMSATASVANAQVKAVANSQANRIGGQSYTVASGDTLALIAIKLYGSALATDQLLSDNPTLRQNPNALRIGQVLKFNMQ